MQVVKLRAVRELWQHKLLALIAMFSGIAENISFWQPTFAVSQDTPAAYMHLSITPVGHVCADAAFTAIKANAKLKTILFIFNAPN